MLAWLRKMKRAMRYAGGGPKPLPLPKPGLLGLLARTLCRYEPTNLPGGKYNLLPATDRRGFYLLPFVGIVAYRLRPTYGYGPDRIVLADRFQEVKPPSRTLREQIDESFIANGIHHDDILERN